MDNLDSTTRIGIWVPLTRGKFALVDREDYELVAKFRWHATSDKESGTQYAVTRLRMHQLILSHVGDGRVVDHIDGYGLNNSRSNLRPATNAQNCWNQKSKSTNKLQVKGVNCRNGRYAARITQNGKTRHLGTFATPEEAARSYDAAARKYFGEFARENFADDGMDDLRNVDNLRTKSVGKSGYLGVVIRGDHFGARIWNGRKRIWLGNFPTAEEAARAYDAAGRCLFLRFFRANFPV